jgi:multiple sugar transport system ATP-binding protein
MANVKLQNLGKRYDNGAHAVVSDVNLHIEHGELFVLLGPSGCGKSTTLRMIAGLEEITDGQLFIDDVQVNGLPAKDRDIAMVFQSYALYPHMTVRDNLAFGLRRRNFKHDEIDRRVSLASQILGLDPYIDRKPHALSGGQRQRVALGRAIVRDPKVFLFDEPLSNLDAALRVSTRAELAALHARLKATMIYVTHDQVEAMTMGTRICIMNAGRVEQVGPPLEVYRNPANTFVAGFLGSPPMNLMPCELTRSVAGDRLALGTQFLEVQGLLERLPASVVASQSLTFGIRPEDISLCNGSGIEAEVLNTEALGAETLLLLRLSGLSTPLRARVGRDERPEKGSKVGIALDIQCAKLFDTASGKALF